MRLNSLTGSEFSPILVGILLTDLIASNYRLFLEAIRSVLVKALPQNHQASPPIQSLELESIRSRQRPRKSPLEWSPERLDTAQSAFGSQESLSIVRR